MTWARVDTEPLDIDSDIAPLRARAISAALERIAVPVLTDYLGRVEPLASGALYQCGSALVLVTCRHLFDAGLCAGDLAVPLGETGQILWLRNARPRVLVDPQADLAAVQIRCRRAAGLLRRHHRLTPFGLLAADVMPTTYVLAGFPYAQMRRIGGVLHARPIVVFGRGQNVEGQLKLSYRRIARRADGVEIHAPALDGVSGATLWAVFEQTEGGPCNGAAACVLQPAAVQSSFKHDAFVRAEPLSGFFRDLRHQLA